MEDNTLPASDPQPAQWNCKYTVNDANGVFVRDGTVAVMAVDPADATSAAAAVISGMLTEADEASGSLSGYTFHIDELTLA